MIAYHKKRLKMYKKEELSAYLKFFHREQNEQPLVLQEKF